MRIETVVNGQRLVGTVTDNVTGQRYTMKHTPAGEPMLVNRNTGKSFTLTWEGMLKLARRAGIDATS